LLKTDGVIRPFIFQDREPVEFTALTEDSDEGFRREKFLYGVRARYRIAYGYWQYAVRMDFTSPT
jgi:phage major head subunit gpT-like protein